MPPIGENSWDRTLPACTKFPDPGSTQLACHFNRKTSCTQDACGPRRPQPMDQPPLFIRETKTPRITEATRRFRLKSIWDSGVVPDPDNGSLTPSVRPTVILVRPYS